MRTSKFSFTLEFPPESVNTEQAALQGEVQSFPGVEAIKFEGSTPSCPLGRMVVEVSFERGAQGRRLFNRIIRCLKKHPAVAVVSQRYTLSDLFFDHKAN